MELEEGEERIEKNENGVLPFVNGDFLEFMKNNNIPMDAYNINEISRFIRINPRSPISQAELEKQLNTTIHPVSWLPLFYRLNKDVSIASCDAYKKGNIYGIDVSSGAVVYALDCQRGDNVLDVCCAPGSKFCLLADVMDHTGTVTGVDVSPNRISVCKTVVKKYFHLGGRDGIPARLFLADGSTFSVLAPRSKFINTNHSNNNNNNNTTPLTENSSSLSSPSSIPSTSTTTTSSSIATPLDPSTSSSSSSPSFSSSSENSNSSSTSTSTTTATTDNSQPQFVLPPLPSHVSIDATPPPSKRAKRRKGREKDLPGLYFSNDYSIRIPETGAVQLYDRILVDAECTLDASIRHLLFTTPELTELQRRLICNAFRLLKAGGTMVYSTCSFCVSQNEDIVNYLLQHEPSARVVPITLPRGEAGEKAREKVDEEGKEAEGKEGGAPWSEGSLKHTVRLYPRQSGTSGMFIAKIIKTII